MADARVRARARRGQHLVAGARAADAVAAPDEGGLPARRHHGHLAEAANRHVLGHAHALDVGARAHEDDAAVLRFVDRRVDRRRAVGHEYGKEPQPGKTDYYPMAVFHYHAGKLSTIYSRDYIESCFRFPEVPRLTDRQRAALDLFDKLSESKELRLDMAFEPGDIQFLHNHQILHARAGFEDWPDVERRRHLLRLWLCPKEGRPLPDSMIERYLTVKIGDRGGILGPDTKLNVPLEPV